MRLKVLSSLLLASGIASAAAPIDGWYSNLLGGFAWYPGNINVIPPEPVLWNHVRYHWGYNAGGAIGFKSNPLRYELQYTYTKAQDKTLSINQMPPLRHDGYSQASFGMLNVYYDFPDMVYAISPYVGAGLGYGYVNTVLGGVDSVGNIHFLKRNGGNFAWQVTGGLTYNFVENFAVNVDYRYAATTRLRDFGKTFQANFVEAGVTYRFDDVRYK